MQEDDEPLPGCVTKSGGTNRQIRWHQAAIHVLLSKIEYISLLESLILTLIIHT